MKIIFSILFFIILGFSSQAVPLQTEKDSTANIQEKVKLTDVYVIDVYKSRYSRKRAASVQRDQTTFPDTLDFGDTLVVQLKNIDVLLDQREVKLSDIRLFINEFAVNSLIPIRCVNDKNEVCFILNERLLTVNEKNYIKTLPGLFLKEIGVGIQIRDTDVFYKCSKKLLIGLTGFKDLYIISIVFSVILFIFLMLLCKKTALVRDKSILPRIKRPFSLSRSQLAWWTYIILASYLFIYLVTGETELLNFTAVTLLGISAGTTAVGTTIDSSESAEDRHQNNESQGWLTDILSDSSGISIHRLQSLIFNLIFGVIFIRYVVSNFAMPEFSDNQLILLGLSAGTYSFVKTRENKNPVATTPPGPTSQNESDKT